MSRYKRLSLPLFRSDTTIQNEAIAATTREQITIPSGATSVMASTKTNKIIWVGPTNTAASGIPLQSINLEKTVWIKLSSSATLYAENTHSSEQTIYLVWMYD